MSTYDKSEERRFELQSRRTYPNLLAWFKNFQVFLVKFGFCEVNSDEDLTFTEEPKHRVLNVDKTEISLNMSKTRAGGRLVVSFHDPHLPLTSRSVSKSSLACTGIFGSSAAGKCKPLHFQLPTSVMAKEREKIQYEFLIHILDTRGKFGCTEERSWLCMIGMNKKGGMTDKEFENTSTTTLSLSTPTLKTRPKKASY